MPPNDPPNAVSQSGDRLTLLRVAVEDSDSNLWNDLLANEADLIITSEIMHSDKMGMIRHTGCLAERVVYKLENLYLPRAGNR